MPDLSIVLGTYNRLAYLTDCLRSIRHAVGQLNYEIIVVDGGSTDGTLDYLKKVPDLFWIAHGELKGCVKAYNDGFTAATGKYVAYLNDDLTVRPGTLQAACDILDTDKDAGIVAIQYSNNGGPMTCGYTKVGGGRYPFASFGVLRKELGERAGWFDGYYHYFGDCHLSLSILDMGYSVYTLSEQYGIDHYAADNSVRGNNRWTAAPQAGMKARLDGQRYIDHWGNWKGPHGSGI